MEGPNFVGVSIQQRLCCAEQLMSYCDWRSVKGVKLKTIYPLRAVQVRVGLGLGVTMAQYCITACSEKCSLASNLHAQQQGIAFQ